MKFRKRLVSLLLTCGLFLTGIPFEAIATNETDKIANIEDTIYYSDLFYAYPHYLANDAYFTDYSSNLTEVYETVYLAYKNSPLVLGTGVQYSLDTITSPRDFTKFITDTLKLTDFSYNDALDAANDLFIRNILSDSSLYSIEKSWGKIASYNAQLNDIAGYFNQLKLSNDNESINYSAEYFVQEAFDFLQDKGYLSFVSDQMLAQIWVEINNQDFKLSNYFSVAKTEIDIAKAFVTALMLENSRLEIVDAIIATQKNDTVLKQGMTRLKNQLQGNFVTYFLKNYITEKLLDKVCEAAGKLVVDAITGQELAALLKVAKNVVALSINAPSYADVLKFQVLICYSRDLAGSIPKLAQSFNEGLFLSDKIFEYENIFVAYSSINDALIETTNSFADMLDPYAEAYEVLIEARENNIENVTITTGTLKIPISSNTNSDEFYKILTLQKTLSVELTPITLASKITVSNGISTVKVDINANLLLSAFSEGISECQQVIQNFNAIYEDTSLYIEHIKHVKKIISQINKNERIVPSYNGRTLNVYKGIQIRKQSDIIERECYYTVNNVLLVGRVNINIDFSCDIDLIFPCSVFITDNSKINGNLTIRGSLYLGQSYLSSDTLTFSGKMTICNYLYLRGDGSLVNNGVISVGGNTEWYSYWGHDRSAITNNGEFISKGSFKPLGFQMVNDSASLTLSGDCSLGWNLKYMAGGDNRVVKLDKGTVVINGTSIQTLNGMIAPTILVENRSSDGVVFTDHIRCSILFNASGANVKFYNNGIGSSFADYDGDGIKDNVDPQPTVGNPCTVTVVSESSEKGTVSDSILNVFGGTTVTISATPTFKYEFSKWVDSSGKTVSTNSEYTFIAKADSCLTAVFTKRKRLIIQQMDNGYVSCPPRAEIESTVHVEPYGNSGYVYDEGTLCYNGIPIVDGTFVMPDEDIVITASFSRNESYFSLERAIESAWEYSWRDYTTESYAALEDAIYSAWAVMQNDISEEESNRHTTAIQNAINSLVPKSIDHLQVVFTPQIYVGVATMLNDLSVRAVYDNGTYDTISNFQISGFDCNQLGEQEITITYEGVSLVTIVTVEQREISDTHIAMDDAFVFMGADHPLEPTPTISYLLTDEVLQCDRDYTIVYENNARIGTARMVVTGIGNYTGSTALPFEIYCQHTEEVLAAVEPTCTDTGLTEGIKCSICNENILEQEIIPAIGHTISHIESVPASCEETGIEEYWQCEACGKLFSDAEAETEMMEPITIPAFDHLWDKGVIAHTPSCVVSGLKIYTCQRNSKHTKSEVIPAMDHTLSHIESVPASCEETGIEEYWQCEACGKLFFDAEAETEMMEPITIPAFDHLWDKGVIAHTPSCMVSGLKIYTCQRNSKHTKSEVIPAMGHTLSSINGIAATCEETGVEKYWQCDVCGSMYSDSQGQMEIKRPVTIAAVGHDWSEWSFEKEATESDDGIKIRVCYRDSSHTEIETIPATGKTPTHSSSSGGGGGTVELEPDEQVIITNLDGSQTFTKTASDGTVTATTTWEDGKKAIAVTSPEGAKSIVVFTAEGETIADIEVPAKPGVAKEFKDVQIGSWYKNAVDSATGYGLFNGTSETTFSPNDGMTRGMMVTVLHNLSGKPEYGTGTSIFEDVNHGIWYEDPVDWAYKIGVTSGTSSTEFSPNDEITREQLVTMLYRYAEKIGAASNNRKAITSFPDGDNVTEYAQNAMQWAVAEGFISGRTSGGKKYIAPQGTATRAEVAAVLTRFVEYLKK